METTLIFHDGVDLPLFASFDLLKSNEGIERTRAYYARYCKLARDAELGFVLESPTWRANFDWAKKLGYTREELARINRKAITVMADLRHEYETPRSPMVISGNIGPRGDGYQPGKLMSADEAQAYHAEQIAAFKDTAADLVSAFTMNYVEEPIGIARAAKAAGMPVVISLTLETDGRLPTGQTLKDAIVEIDAETGKAPAYYMINCAHPTHFESALEAGEALDQTPARTSRQRIDAQPRRARSGDRPRRRQSGRARAAVCRSAPQAAARHRSGRLLRHRLPPRRADLLCLRTGGVTLALHAILT